MKRKLLAGLFAGALWLSICQGTVIASEQPLFTESAPKASSKMSDNIYSFEVSIDGELYQFPMSYEEFTAKGWSYEADKTAELSPAAYSSSEIFSKGDLSICVVIFNLASESTPVSQCMIGGILVESSQLQGAPQTTLELPKGIVFGASTLEDVTAAYGLPDRTEKGDSYTTLTYEYDSFQYIDLSIDLTTNVLNKIDVRNLTDKKDTAADNNTGAETETVTDIVSETESIPETQAVPETESALETQAIPETESALETQAIPETESALEIQAISETESVAETQAAPFEMSDDIYSFQAKINGELYQFPMSYEAFTAMGWKYKDDETQELAPNYYSTFETFVKDSFILDTTIYNLGLNTIPISKCNIGGISFDQYQFEKEPEIQIELPGGIVYGKSTFEDITAAYGTPTDTYEGDLYTKLTYQYDYQQKVSLYIDAETNVLNKFEINNLTVDEENRNADASNVSSEPTPEVLAYQPPSELGTDFLAFTADFAGNLYRLPAPVSAFLDNGWTLLKENSDSVVAGRNTGTVTLMKDNQKFRTYVKNYNADAAAIENCFVTHIEVSINTSLPLTLPNGISMGMSEEELLAALGDIYYEVDESGAPYIYYTIKEDPEYTSNTVQVVVTREEEALVSRITIDNRPDSVN